MWWERSQLKEKAKHSLRAYYWLAVGACFIGAMLGGSSGGSINLSAPSSYSSMTNSLRDMGRISPEFLLGVFIGMMIGIIIGLGLGLVIIAFLGNPIRVGLCRFFMEGRSSRASFSTLFWAFKEGRYMKVVKITFKASLKIFLWSLLFIIPGIIKSYEYLYVWYIAAENPDIDPERALELSKNMTENDKMNIFVLDLSFLGWNLLAALTCGVGFIFLNPYIQATYAELYAVNRERAFASGMTGPNELYGFEPVWPNQGFNYYNQPPYQPPQGQNYGQPDSQPIQPPYQPPQNQNYGQPDSQPVQPPYQPPQGQNYGQPDSQPVQNNEPTDENQ